MSKNNTVVKAKRKAAGTAANAKGTNWVKGVNPAQTKKANRRRKQ